MASESSGGVAAVVINYNGAALLDGCLGSLTGQTQAPAEIVVIDNRSTDDSVLSAL